MKRRSGGALGLAVVVTALSAVTAVMLVAGKLFRRSRVEAALDNFEAGEVDEAQQAAACLLYTSGFFRGERNYSKMIEKLSTGDFNSHFSDDANGTDWLTRDEEEQRKYREDPHCGVPFKIGGYRELAYLVKSVSGRQWADRMPKDLPVFLYSGEKDPVGGFGKGVTEVYDLLQSAGVTDVTLTLYAGGRHEMHHELNREEVFENIRLFIEAHLPALQQFGNGKQNEEQAADKVR